MKVGLIYQPCGLGDILFLQKLAYHMKDMGYEVYWPVVYEFEWLNNYIPDFHFVSWDDSASRLIAPPLPAHVRFPFKDMYSPHRPTEITEEIFYFQGFVVCNPIMAGKYAGIDLGWKDWRQYVKFNRNKEKEDELYYNKLGLHDDEDFVFVNRYYGIRPHVYTLEHIPVDESVYGCRVVQLGLFEGFSLFDWVKVLERARGIYMVESALNYVLESPFLFDTVKNKLLQLYSRSGHFNEVAYLFELPWSYQ